VLPEKNLPFSQFKQLNRCAAMRHLPSSVDMGFFSLNFNRPTVTTARLARAFYALSA